MGNFFWTRLTNGNIVNNPTFPQENPSTRWSYPEIWVESGVIVRPSKIIFIVITYRTQHYNKNLEMKRSSREK